MLSLLHMLCLLHLLSRLLCGCSTFSRLTTHCSILSPSFVVMTDTYPEPLGCAFLVKFCLSVSRLLFPRICYQLQLERGWLLQPISGSKADAVSLTRLVPRKPCHLSSSVLSPNASGYLMHPFSHPRLIVYQINPESGQVSPAGYTLLGNCSCEHLLDGKTLGPQAAL